MLDDHPIVLLAVRTMLSDSADFELCEAPKPGHPLLAWVERQLPDLIILDLLLDGRSGLDLLPGILRVAPAARVGSIPVSTRRGTGSGRFGWARRGM